MGEKMNPRGLGEVGVARHAPDGLDAVVVLVPRRRVRPVPAELRARGPSVGVGYVGMASCNATGSLLETPCEDG